MLKLEQNIARLICFVSALLIGVNVLLSANAVSEQAKATIAYSVKTKKKLINNTQQIEEINLACDLIKDPFESDFEKSFHFVDFNDHRTVFAIFVTKKSSENSYANYQTSFKKNPLWIRNRQILI